MDEYCIVLCTCPDKDTAQSIARQSVEQQLAACVNIIDGITSVYSWQGQIQQDSEYQLVFKTMHSQVDELFKLVLSIHPYDVPEWLVLDITGGSDDYLNWIRSNLK